MLMRGTMVPPPPPQPGGFQPGFQQQQQGFESLPPPLPPPPGANFQPAFPPQQGLESLPPPLPPPPGGGNFQQQQQQGPPLGDPTMFGRGTVIPPPPQLPPVGQFNNQPPPQPPPQAQPNFAQPQSFGGLQFQQPPSPAPQQPGFQPLPPPTPDKPFGGAPPIPKLLSRAPPPPQDDGGGGGAPPPAPPAPEPTPSPAAPPQGGPTGVQSFSNIQQGPEVERYTNAAALFARATALAALKAQLPPSLPKPEPVAEQPPMLFADLAQGAGPPSAPPRSMQPQPQQQSPVAEATQPPMLFADLAQGAGPPNAPPRSAQPQVQQPPVAQAPQPPSGAPTFLEQIAMGSPLSPLRSLKPQSPPRAGGVGPPQSAVIRNALANLKKPTRRTAEQQTPQQQKQKAIQPSQFRARRSPTTNGGVSKRTRQVTRRTRATATGNTRRVPRTQQTNTQAVKPKIEQKKATYYDGNASPISSKRATDKLQKLKEASDARNNAKLKQKNERPVTYYDGSAPAYSSKRLPSKMSPEPKETRRSSVRRGLYSLFDGNSAATGTLRSPADVMKTFGRWGTKPATVKRMEPGGNYGGGKLVAESMNPRFQASSSSLLQTDVESPQAVRRSLVAMRSSPPSVQQEQQEPQKEQQQQQRRATVLKTRALVTRRTEKQKSRAVGNPPTRKGGKPTGGWAWGATVKPENTSDNSARSQAQTRATSGRKNRAAASGRTIAKSSHTRGGITAKSVGDTTTVYEVEPSEDDSKLPDGSGTFGFESDDIDSYVTEESKGFRPDTEDLVSVLAQQRREIDRLNGLADRLEGLVRDRRD